MVRPTTSGEMPNEGAADEEFGAGDERGQAGEEQKDEQAEWLPDGT